MVKTTDLSQNQRACAKILETFGGDAIRKAQDRLCSECVWWDPGKYCKKRLLPLTSKGEDCIYCTKKPDTG